MKNLFEEPYTDIVNFPVDVFTDTVQSPDITDGSGSGWTDGSDLPLEEE